MDYALSIGIDNDPLVSPDWLATAGWGQHTMYGSRFVSVCRRLTPLSQAALARQTLELRGSGATSQDNAGQGFLPAFRDTATGQVYPSCFADGRPACVHILEGLPADLAITRDEQGRIFTVKPSVEPGFVLAGRFYTREEASRYVNAVPMRAHG